MFIAALFTIAVVWKQPKVHEGFQVALVVKSLPADAGDIKTPGSDPWVGKIPWRRP